jgi:hypothetical protein
MFDAVKCFRVVTILFGAAACGSGGDAGFNAEVRTDLLAMAEVDDELRSQLVSAENPDTANLRKLLESEMEHSARLRTILEEHGWPGVDMAGSDGSASAWTLLKHGDVNLKELGLRLIEESDDPGVPVADVATMTDEVLVEQGKPQLYGTQFMMAHGGLVQHPVDDRDSVDVRRERVGLPPMDEYMRMIEGAHGMSMQGASPHAGMTANPQVRPDTSENQDR